MIKKIALLSSIVLITLLFIYCTTDESTIIGPFGNSDKYVSVASVVEKETVYSKGDSSIVTIRVLDVNNSPAIGLRVSFTAQFGSITESVLTDSSGIAVATFISDENTGANIITVDTGIKKYTLVINVVNYHPKYIELFSESPVLLADGISSTIITAVLKDSVGNPMSDMTVNFTTTLGVLESQIELTDNDGMAKTKLTSSVIQGEATITASAGIEKSIAVIFHMDVPALIELSAEYPVLLADGSSSTKVTATVRDESGARMAYEKVSFFTNLGEVEPSVEQTGLDGIATTTLISSTTPGTARVIATSFVSDTTYVEFNINIPTYMEVYSTPNQIIADGQSISIITAIPKDSNFAPMVGVPVQFTTTLGLLKEASKITNGDGIAEVELVSDATAGEAEVTATSSIKGKAIVTFIAYNPASIELIAEENSILADGISEVDITARVINSAGSIIPGAVVNFSTNYGSFYGSSNTTSVRANQEGNAIVTLRSAGSVTGFDTEVTAEVQDTDISETVMVRFRGITMTTYVDSAQFATGGYYNVFVRAELIDNDEGTAVVNATVAFESTIGTMVPEADGTDEFGRAFSMMYTGVTGTYQGGLIVTPELFHASEVSAPTPSMEIPGVETLISTVDDEVMGDGEGWALVKATLREVTGEAIINTDIDWETTVGTIIGQSRTNTSGHTIDTLRIENSVSSDTDVTITANYGDNVSISDVITFIEPITSNRIILGFEPDTSGHGFIPCDIDTVEIGTRDMGITALFVNANSNPIGGELISFRIVPNNMAAICESTSTIGDENGRSTVMVAYPIQNSGEIVRIWAEAPDETTGSIDVILPTVIAEEGG